MFLLKSPLEGRFPLASKLPKLRRLRLDSAYNFPFSYDVLKHILPPTMDSVELKVANCHLGNEQLGRLSILANLSVLSLTGSPAEKLLKDYRLETCNYLKRSLDLECLELIATNCPRLEQLIICAAALDTSTLSQTRGAFKHLCSIEFVST
jgi:hypothetical protein